MPKSWNVVFMLPMLLSGAARADDRQHTEQLVLAPPDNLGTGNCNDDEARQIEYITNDAQWIETSAAGAWDNPQAPNFYNATKKWFGSNGSSAVGAVLGNVQKQLETRNFQFYCNPPDAS